MHSSSIKQCNTVIIQHGLIPKGQVLPITSLTPKLDIATLDMKGLSCKDLHVHLGIAIDSILIQEIEHVHTHQIK